jgi:hypothetical protein
MTNASNNITIAVVSLLDGEPVKMPNICLAVGTLAVDYNLKEVKSILLNNFKEIRTEITLQNYKSAKLNMVALNKLKEAIDALIKEKIEIPETTLKEIKIEAKEILNIINAEREYYKNGYEEVYGIAKKQKIKELITSEINFQYEKEQLEEQYKIITEEQINKLCIVSNGDFPADKDGQFEWIYLTPKCRKEIIALVQNCLQFKQQRFNRVQALKLANLETNLEPLHQIKFEDIESFIDALEPEFTQKLTAIINKAANKQNEIKNATAKALAEEKAKLEIEAKAREDKARKQAEAEARLKAEAEAKIRLEQEAKQKAEFEKQLAEEKAKSETLQKEKEALEVKAQILVKQETVATELVKYEVLCSYDAEIEDKGGAEMDKICAKHLAQGFKTVKFIKKL